MMEEFTLTREEMLELAKLDTFHLDDRLCPFSREDLRAEAWLKGYMFSRQHPKKAEEEAVNAPTLLPDIAAKGQWTKEDQEMVSCLISFFDKELEDLRNDRYGHQEIVSDLKESLREKIDWLESLRDRMAKKES